MSVRVGIMQGRLSPRPPDRLQAFPSHWQEEFETAAQLGFELIEWLLLPAGEGSNPLDTGAGRREIRRVAAGAGIAVASVCAVRCMYEPILSLSEIIPMAAEIGATRVIVPLLETAHIHTPERETAAVADLSACAVVAERASVTLALEVDLPGDACARILQRAGHPRVRACYDAGNQTALGLNVAQDIAPLLHLVDEVHIKDRRTAGASVPIGTGDANFTGLFQALRHGGYESDLVLEHFFEKDPRGEARRALDFVRRSVRAAGFGS
jgi:L-ribulose-5-phosphate 3-epimerase